MMVAQPTGRPGPEEANNLATETGLLKQWPESGPPLAWKANGIGRGYSTVSVAGGKIFTMGDRADAGYVHGQAVRRFLGKRAFQAGNHGR